MPEFSGNVRKIKPYMRVCDLRVADSLFRAISIKQHMANKYYVVFRGHNPGVYYDWEEVKLQTSGFPGALFKGYDSSEEASQAYRNFTGEEDREELFRLINTPANTSIPDNPEIDHDAWAVDASCLGNPGVMEYRCVDLKTGQVVFQRGPFQDATNNIGEYLALVHAMSLMTQKGEYHTIYSDSQTALSWMRRRMVKTKLKPTDNNARVFELLGRASFWVQTHHFPGKVLKWDTDRWGEIPADYGRK